MFYAFIIFISFMPTGEMVQNLFFPFNVIIIFLYISSFQNGLYDISISCGCLFMVDNVRGGILKCIGKTKENILRLQKTETAICIYIYSSLANFQIFPEKNQPIWTKMWPKFGKFEIFAKFEVPKFA